VQADLPRLYVMLMRKLGQKLAFEFEFWGLSGKIRVLPLQNCAVLQDYKNE